MASKAQLYQLPKIDFTIAKRSWFIYEHKAYSVQSAPVDVFKAAVLAKSPQWKQCATYCHVLTEPRIDYATRWWLLNSLADKHCAITLYDTRDAAMAALGV